MGGGSLGSTDVVGEEGSLREGVTPTKRVVVALVAAVAAAQGTNTGAVGRSDTALIGDTLRVAGAVTTAGAAGDDVVEVGGLQGSESLVGAIVRPGGLVLQPSK